MSKITTALRKNIEHFLANKKTFNIVFLGDSITSAEWVHPNWRSIVEYVLKTEFESFDTLNNKEITWNMSWWHLKFFNAGLNGALSSDLLSSLSQDVLDHKPDLVLFFSSGNDVGKVDKNEYLTQQKTIIEQLKKHVPYVFISSYIYTANEVYNTKYQEYYHLLRNLVDDKELNFIDLRFFMQTLKLDDIYTFPITGPEEKFLASESFFNATIDTFHPNALGNAYIAAHFLEYIFGISFNPELYIQGVEAGLKYPKY